MRLENEIILKKFLDVGIQNPKHVYLDSAQMGRNWLRSLRRANGDDMWQTYIATT